MSLVFGAVNSDRVNGGSGSSIDTLDPVTVIAWVLQTTLTNGNGICVKGGGGNNSRRWEFALSGASGELTCVVDRATTDASAVSSGTPLATASKWYCVAVVVSSAAANVVKLYVGDLLVSMAECAYTSQANGAGALANDAAETLFIGNLKSNVNAWQGRIAVVAVINRALTLGELQAWQFRPGMVANTVGLWWLGANGTGTQPDMSGNANAGTVTGATVGDFLPLGQGIDARDDRAASGAGGADTTLAGAATVSVTASGALSTAITLAGAATVAVTATGAITTAITMAGTASVTLSAAGDVSTAITMAAAAAVTLSATGAITTAITLAGAASVVVSATGDLSAGSNLAGAAAVAITATGVLSTAIVLGGAATVTLAAAGVLTTAITMAGSGSIVITATGALSAGVSIAAKLLRAVGATIARQAVGASASRSAN